MIYYFIMDNKINVMVKELSIEDKKKVEDKKVEDKKVEDKKVEDKKNEKRYRVFH